MEISSVVIFSVVTLVVVLTSVTASHWMFTQQTHFSRQESWVLQPLQWAVQLLPRLLPSLPDCRPVTHSLAGHNFFLTQPGPVKNCSFSPAQYGVQEFIGNN